MSFGKQDANDIMQSIRAYTEHLPNVHLPTALDATADPWPLKQQSFDAILAVNIVHISPFSATVGLFRGASQLLTSGGQLFVYGPFVQRGVQLSDGNVEFDRGLRAQNSRWGLCEVETVARVAADFDIVLLHTFELPANNLMLVFRSAGHSD